MPDQIALKTPVTNPTIASIDGMVSEVASLIGGEGDPNVKAKALKSLDRAADRMNMAGLYLFRRKEVNYQTAAAGGSGTTLLENDDQTLPTPSDWGWPERSVVAIDSNSNRLKQLFWQPWETFRLISAQDTTSASGIPEFISIRNELEALLHFWPPIDTDSVAEIIVPYYARILRPSEVSDSNLFASNEVIEALITGGEAFMMRFRHKNQPQQWLPFWNDFKDAITMAKGASHRNQQVQDIWAIPGETGYDNDGIGTSNSRFLVIDLEG